MARRTPSHLLRGRRTLSGEVGLSRSPPSPRDRLGAPSRISELGPWTSDLGRGASRPLSLDVLKQFLEQWPDLFARLAELVRPAAAARSVIFDPAEDLVSLE